MPRLPSFTDLGGSPSPQPSGSVARFSTEGSNDGMDALLKTVDKVQAKHEDQQNRIEEAYANAALLKGNIESVEKLRDDPDFSTYGQKYDQMSNSYLGNAANMITNPQRRELWQAEAQQTILRTRADVANLAHNKRLDYIRGTTDESVQGNIDLIARTTDPAQKEALLKNITQLRDASYANGAVNYDSTVAQKKLDAVNAWKAGLPKDPIERLKYLENKPADNTAASAASYVIDKFEGTGYVPKDSTQGASKFGITQNTLSDVLGRPATEDDVKNLSRAQAEDIYKTKYWSAIGADNLPDNMKFAAFDTAVNFGVDTAKKMIAQSDNDPKKLIALRDEKRRALIRANPDTYKKYASAWAARDQAVSSMASGVDPKYGNTTDIIPENIVKEVRDDAQKQAVSLVTKKDIDAMAGNIQANNDVIQAWRNGTATFSQVENSTLEPTIKEDIQKNMMNRLIPYKTPEEQSNALVEVSSNFDGLAKKVKGKGYRATDNLQELSKFKYDLDKKFSGGLIKKNEYDTWNQRVMGVIAGRAKNRGEETHWGSDLNDDFDAEYRPGIDAIAAAAKGMDEKNQALFKARAVTNLYALADQMGLKDKPPSQQNDILNDVTKKAIELAATEKVPILRLLDGRPNFAITSDANGMTKMPVSSDKSTVKPDAQVSANFTTGWAEDNGRKFRARRYADGRIEEIK